jgi:hypothetical protein
VPHDSHILLAWPVYRRILMENTVPAAQQEPNDNGDSIKAGLLPPPPPL